MKKILRKLSKIIPESKFKTKLRCWRNNFLTHNKFKVFQKQNFLQFNFRDGNQLKCIVTQGSGTIIEEARIISKGYLKYYKIKNRDIIIDCGAHIGMFSLFASKKVGSSGKIIALEPDPENYKQLLENIKINKIKNIIPIKKGVWKNEGELNFEGSLGAGSIISEKKSNQKISVSTIDKITEDLKLKKVDFVKMDIEGAEIEAVGGAEKTLKKNSTNLSIASYHIREGAKTFKRVEKILKEMNYDTKTTFPDHLTTFAKPKEF